MVLHDDGGLLLLAIIIGVFLFGGEPDIADMVLEYLKLQTLLGVY